MFYTPWAQHGACCLLQVRMSCSEADADVCGGRTLDDVEEAAKPGGPLAPGGAAPLSIAARFSLEHRSDLLEACPEEDIVEMETVVKAAMVRYSGKYITFLVYCFLCVFPLRLLEGSTQILLYPGAVRPR
jgi:hypothetical protein